MDADARADSTVPFFWNRRLLQARPGDTLAIALWRNGIRALSASRKRHRPLGAGSPVVLGALVTVDGVPHVHADRIEVSAGMRVQNEAAWPHPGLNLLALLRYLPARWLQAGVENPRLLPGGSLRFALWERLLMTFAGSASAPKRAIPCPKGRRIECDVLVIGAGPTGIAAAQEAAARGERVCLVSRSATLQSHATQLGRPLATLDPTVVTLLGHEAIGVYRRGSLVLAAPHAADAPAVVLTCRHLVLATGQDSVGPSVPGHDLPGVLDARSALRWSERLGALLGPTVVVGTGAEADVARALSARGVTVVACVPQAALTAIEGRRAVTGVVIDGRRVACHSVIHAGPWLRDDALSYQASADGTLRLSAGALPVGVTVRVPEPSQDQAIALAGDSAKQMVCSCMDVSAAEVLAHVNAGITHVEELKRLTSCGMGPCQGHPCWLRLGAVVAQATGVMSEDRPSARPPRRGLSVAQAAGLDGLVECE